MSKILFDYDYVISANDKVFLEDIVDDATYEKMFRSKNISVLNKGRCGNGGIHQLCANASQGVSDTCTEQEYSNLQGKGLCGQRGSVLCLWWM